MLDAQDAQQPLCQQVRPDVHLCLSTICLCIGPHVYTNELLSCFCILPDCSMMLQDPARTRHDPGLLMQVGWLNHQL